MSKLIFRSIVIVIVTSVLALASLRVCAQTGGTARYVYDDNGRLHAVIAPNGEAAVYDYDAAGNFTQIRRLAADAFEILDFAPKKGIAGDSVSFYGVGFANGAASVSFNGGSATVVQTTANLIVAIVPDNATTGLISITNTKGTVTTPGPFTVLTGIRVTPPAVSLLQGQTAQFTAHVSGPIDHSVQWSVNGINGGNSTVGTVSTTGLYTAPALFFLPIVVRATVIAQTSLFSESKVTLQTVSDNTSAAFASVSVIRAQDSGTGQSVSPNTAVSIGRVNPADAQSSATPNIAVSVGRITPEESQTSISPAARISSTKGPDITSVAPAQLTAGATVTITINGSNLTGITTVKFLNSDLSSDSTIAATNLVINGTGTSLTATITVNANATVGQRIVIVANANGQSLLAATAGNTVQIIH